MAWALLAALVFAALPGQAASGIFSVREFGAIGDGLSRDTEAINRAIAAGAAAGGGQVRFTPGRYLSGTVSLRSGIALYLEAGATLVGTTNLAEYQHFNPPEGTPEARFRRSWHRALILGDDVEDVTIAGPGVIDGAKVFDAQGEERMRGPHTIIFGESRRLTLRDFTVKDSANYAIMLEHCGQVDMRNLRMTGGWDGIHFRGWPGRPCRDISIIGCQFYTGDDAIAGRYWENVLISDCMINSSCNGVRLIGPALQLIIRDCLFFGPGVEPHRSSRRHNMLSGIILQPGAWDATEGPLDGVLISDITMKDVASPVTLWTKRGNTVGTVTINRLNATGVYRAAVSVESWSDSPITNVVLRDVQVDYSGGGTREQAGRAVKGPGVDARPLPAWGLYARHVQNLRLDNVRLTLAQPDLRPPVFAEEVGHLHLDGFRFDPPDAETPPFVLKGVGALTLRDTELRQVEPVLKELRISPMDVAGQVRAGQPLTVSLAVQNGSQAGWAHVPLTVGTNALSRSLWLQPQESKEVTFGPLSAPGLGSLAIRAGQVETNVLVQP